jgi:alkylation response protein AidB-like acyl-CoA dehydrogenase
MDRFELRRQDYSLDEEQEAVQEAFRNFFVSECPSSLVRRVEPLGFDERLWMKLVGMGVTSMSLPAAQGGDGATLVDLVLIAEELGRVAAPVPFFSHVVTTRMLGAAGADANILAEAFAGDVPFALALDVLRPGQAQLVPDGAIAPNVVALAGDSLVLYRAEKPAAHVPNQGSTPLAWWEPALDGERVTLGDGSLARTLHARAVAEWKLLMSSALIGLTEAALAIAVEFVKTRLTMGVPVGSLQGVSFPLADVAVGTASARNLTLRAAWMTDNEPAARPELVPMAFAYACQTVTHGATTAAHMQGGLGFTVDADASLYFLRAKGWSVLAGDPSLDLIQIGEAVLAAT